MAKDQTITCKRCTVCQHPERLRIEMLRLGGTTADMLAERFDLGRDAVYRHMRSHVSDDMKAALIADTDIKQLAERAAEEGGALLDYLSLLRKLLITQTTHAAAINDHGSTASLARAATDVLREMGRLTGELVNASGVTNITNNIAIMQSPAFSRLQRMLLERLTPFPEALQSVLLGLDELEAMDDPPEPPRPPTALLEGQALAA